MDAAEPDGDAGLSHPYFAKAEPCTMLHPEVEAILAAVNRGDDWSLFSAKLDDIEAMRGGLWGVKRSVSPSPMEREKGTGRSPVGRGEA